MYDLTVVYMTLMYGSFYLALWILVVAYIYGKLRDRWVIRLAKKAEIGDNVTLLQGIRACFGEDGFWSAFTPELVYVHVHDPRLLFAVQMIRGPGRKYRLIPQISDPLHHWVDIDERDVDFGIMVEVVKGEGMIVEVQETAEIAGWTGDFSVRRDGTSRE